MVPAVDISTSPSVDQSDRPSPSVDQSDRPLPSLDQSEQTSRAAGTESGCDGPWPGYPQCGDKIQVRNYFGYNIFGLYPSLPPSRPLSLPFSPIPPSLPPSLPLPLPPCLPQWMMDHWETDKCYAEHGVDGTQCSMQIYLSEVCYIIPYFQTLGKNVSPKGGKGVQHPSLSTG